MVSTIKSLEAFKRFSAVNTNISSMNETVEQNNDIKSVRSVSVSAVFPALKDEGEINVSKLTKINPQDYYNIAVKQKYAYAKTLKEKEEKKEPASKILESDPLTKFNVELKKTAKLPEYAYRGLKGDPDANFYEYLSISKIPYFIGGPMLAAVFAFGMTRNNLQARKSAAIRTKQIAVGVVLYYLGVELAKKAIDVPVKIFRGVDLNQPYENVVNCRTNSKSGDSPKKIEHHKVTESVDFTRWDLMRGDETENNGKHINKRFDELAKKFGIDKDIQESDDTLKGSIKKLIISASAFKYMLAAPFVAMGVALAAQNDTKGNSIWGNIGNGFAENVKNIFNFKSGLKFKQRTTIAKEIIKGNLTNPMKESFKALWGSKGHSNKIGRAIILTSIIAPVLANIRILQLTSEKGNKFVDAKEFSSKSSEINNLKQNS